MVQLAERSLSTPEVRDSNPVIKTFNCCRLLKCKMKQELECPTKKSAQFILFEVDKIFSTFEDWMTGTILVQSSSCSQSGDRNYKLIGYFYSSSNSKRLNIKNWTKRFVENTLLVSGRSIEWRGDSRYRGCEFKSRQIHYFSQSRGCEQCDQIWRKFATLAIFQKSYGNFERFYLVFGEKMNQVWAIFMLLGKFNCCKCPNIEQII